MSAVKQKKKFQLPHVFVLLVVIMLLIVVMTWIIPGGTFEKVVDPVTGVTAVDQDSFTYVTQRKPITILAFFKAIHDGVVQSGNIVVTLLFSAGMIELMQSSGAVKVGVQKVLRRAKGKEFVVVSILALLFTMLGAVGMADGVLPLVPICVSVIMALGYDRMLGFATGVMGLCIGFTSGLVNMYTTGVAQQIVGLPLFSGIGFRMAALVVFFLVMLLYLYGYARRIKKDPNKSYTKEEYLSDLAKTGSVEVEDQPFTWKHKVILLIFAGTLIIKPVGSMNWGWGMPEMNAINLIGAVLIMLVLWQDVNTSCRTFVKGSMGILPGALTIGLSKAIVLLMDQGQIVDTIIHGLAGIFSGKSPLICIILVYLVVVGFNCLVVSGSGKAVILMPILGPLGQLLGINQQVMVHTYLYGDGFTNYFWPTSGLLMASLEMSGVEWGSWVKFSWKIMAILSVVSLAIIGIAQTVNFGPF